MYSKVYVLFLIFSSTLGFAIGNENGSEMDTKDKHSESLWSDVGLNSTSRSTPRKWISQLFQEAERGFHMHPNVTDECKKGLETYTLHLQNQSVWAVRIMESSEWPINGIFYGTNYHTGNWQDCVLAKGPGIKGKYCLAEATLDFLFDVEASRSTSPFADWPNGMDSVWSVLKMYKNQVVRNNRQTLYWAICMPSSCTISDLLMSLNTTLHPVFQQNNINISIDIEPRYCSSEKPEYNTAGHDITCMLFGGLILLVILSSAYDVSQGSFEGWEENSALKLLQLYSLKGLILNSLCIIGEKKKQSFLLELFKCFSAKHNYKALTQVSTSTYPMIYTIKLYYMLLTIYAHRLMHIIGAANNAVEEMEVTYKPPSIELVHDGLIDVFFMISGFLSLFLGITPMAKGGTFYLVVSIVARWIRMMPLFMLVMLFAIYILPTLGEGPFWDYRILKEVDICKSSWLNHLLAINNIVDPQKQCLILGYYIAIDIQLFIMGSILLYILTKNKKMGVILMFLTMIAAITATFIVIYVNRYYGHTRLVSSMLIDPRKSEEFTKLYIPTYTRIGPYLAGYAFALLAITLKKKHVTFTHVQTFLIIMITSAIGLGSQYYAFKFYKFNEPYQVLENALFGSLHRLLFASSSAVIICLYVTMGLPKVLKPLENVLFVVLGRLVYGALLTSFLLQIYLTATERQGKSPYGRFRTITYAASDAYLAFLFAFVMYLFLEGPINSILKLFLGKLVKSRKPDNPTELQPAVICRKNLEDAIERQGSEQQKTISC